MNIGIPLRDLGAIDIAPLREAILAQPAEAWLEQTRRQQDYDVHRYTQSIVLVFTDGYLESNIQWSVTAPTLWLSTECRTFTPPAGRLIRAQG